MVSAHGQERANCKSLPCICVQVVEVNLYSIFKLHTHEREALRGQAISLVDEALVPLDLLERGPIVVGDGVEAGAKWHAASGCSSVRVRIGLVDVCVVVEVLFVGQLVARGGSQKSSRPTSWRCAMS